VSDVRGGGRGVWEREERLKSFERSLWFEKERMREGGGS